MINTLSAAKTLKSLIFEELCWLKMREEKNMDNYSSKKLVVQLAEPELVSIYSFDFQVL